MCIGPVHQRGSSLVEVLVAFLVLSLSLLGAQRLQSKLRLDADIARQRSEAVRLSQQEMERLRTLTAGFDAITGGQTDAEASTTGYRVTRQVATPQEGVALKATTVQVAWHDRSGQPQQVALASAIAGVAPVYSAALTLPPSALSVSRPLGRHGHIPRGAQDLGDGRSALKPNERGLVAWVLDHHSGEVVARCAVPGNVGTAQLTTAHLGECDRIRGSLLSGHLRFALGAAPDVRDANDVPLPLSITLPLSGPSSGPATCDSQAMKTVRLRIGGQTHTQAVPIDSTAAALGASSLVELGEHFVSFTCVVIDARWSGQLVFAPQGWALGETAGTHRICRFGTPHADGYRDIQGALRQQNFVVVRGELPCPGDAATHNGGSARTVQHQP